MPLKYCILSPAYRNVLYVLNLKCLIVVFCLLMHDVLYHPACIHSNSVLQSMLLIVKKMKISIKSRVQISMNSVLYMCVIVTVSCLSYCYYHFVCEEWIMAEETVKHFVWFLCFPWHECLQYPAKWSCLHCKSCQNIERSHVSCVFLVSRNHCSTW